MCLTERQRIRTTTMFTGPSAGHSESTFCSSVMKVAEFILLQTSHSPLTITAETLCLSITGEKHTVASWQHIVAISCPTSLHPCCVFRCFERSSMQIRKKIVRNPKKFHFASKRYGVPNLIVYSNLVVYSRGFLLADRME